MVFWLLSLGCLTFTVNEEIKWLLSHLSPEGWKFLIKQGRAITHYLLARLLTLLLPSTSYRCGLESYVTNEEWKAKNGTQDFSCWKGACALLPTGFQWELGPDHTRLVATGKAASKVPWGSLFLGQSSMVWVQPAITCILWRKRCEYAKIFKLWKIEGSTHHAPYQSKTTGNMFLVTRLGNISH